MVVLLNFQEVFLCTLRVCTLWFWVPKPWNMALNKGIWDPKLRGTNIKGTNLKSLKLALTGQVGLRHSLVSEHITQEAAINCNFCCLEAELFLKRHERSN